MTDSSNYCKCYTKISLTCGKCMKPFKIPRSKDEQIKDIKEKLRKCREDAFYYRLELQQLENESENSDKDSSKSKEDSNYNIQENWG